MAWPITAADVRAELGWPPHSGSGEDPVAIHARAAVARIEEEIGPHSGQTITATARGPVTEVVLDHPAASLAGITAGGAAVALDRFTLAAASGIVRGPFPPGDLVVTATAPAAVESPVELAARYLAATWVRQSKVGPPSARSRGQETDGDVLRGFAMPRRVSEMIRPYVPAWGFA